MTGRRIASLYSGNQPAGKFQQTLDIRELGLASGIYNLRLQTGSRNRRFVWLRSNRPAFSINSRCATPRSGEFS